MKSADGGENGVATRSDLVGERGGKVLRRGSEAFLVRILFFMSRLRGGKMEILPIGSVKHGVICKTRARADFLDALSR